MLTPKEKTINLLWTGGWDSTFMLLDQIIMNKRSVQPFYIIDPGRSSLRHELNAMQKIKKKLFSEHPDLRKLLLPTQYIELSNIEPDDEISGAYKRLLKNIALGIQYDWLARFAYSRGIDDLEPGLEKGTGGTTNYLIRFINRIETESSSYYVMDQKYRSTDEYKIFSFFRFPIIEIGKIEMQSISIKENFDHLLDLSWFCHHPRRNGQPCGVCKPCVQAMNEGMHYRLSNFSKLRYYLRHLLSKEHFKKSFPFFYSLISFIRKAFVPGKPKSKPGIY